MKPAPEYLADVDPDEHLNTVVMAGAIHMGLHLAGRDIAVESEDLDGRVTGRLIVSVPFLRSRYLLTIERISDVVPEEVLQEFTELGEQGDGSYRLSKELGVRPGAIPACQGTARFDSQAQAEYVAKAHGEELGGRWAALPCGDHFHVLEQGS